MHARELLLGWNLLLDPSCLALRLAGTHTLNSIDIRDGCHACASIERRVYAVLFFLLPRLRCHLMAACASAYACVSAVTPGRMFIIIIAHLSTGYVHAVDCLY